MSTAKDHPATSMKKEADGVIVQPMQLVARSSDTHALRPPAHGEAQRLVDGRAVRHLAIRCHEVIQQPRGRKPLSWAPADS